MVTRLFWFLLLFLTALPALAVKAPVSQRARLSPASGGLRPSPVDLSHLADAYRTRPREGARRLLSADALPARWDAREQGLVTSVKSQGSYGTCWAFATTAALETALKKNGETDGGKDFDLSENHLATHDVGFDVGFSDGGNNQIAAALLTAWRDPVHERDDPYAHPSSTTNPPPVRHVQNIVWLPEGDTDNPSSVKLEIGCVYKRAVIDYGAVAIGYYHAASCYDSQKGTYYLDDWETFDYNWRTDAGHAVTLIGWDDAFPASEFRERPPGDGAFLCKNSWGSGSGTNGCIWISYYDDALFCLAGAAYPAPEPSTNYGSVYQYDPCGQTVAWNVYEDAEDEARGGKENWCANVFTSSRTGVVEAVGFYALSPGTEYVLRAYADCADSPVSGTLVCEQSGRLDTAGFVTLKLATPVAIRRPNEKFSVVLRLTAPGTDYPIPVEASEVGWTTCSANPGESFLSPDGVNWTDFQEFPSATRTENVCIKAYTRYISHAVTFTPTAVGHTTAVVFTNGTAMAASSSYTLQTNAANVKVVYTAETGYFFIGRAPAVTNGVDTTKNPATADAPEEPLPAVRVGNDAWAQIAGGVCTVFGTGDMWNIDGWPSGVNPLAAYRKEIADVRVELGVTRVGEAMLYKFYAVTNVTLAASVTNIADYAFCNCYALQGITFLGAAPTMGEQAIKFTAAIRMNGSTPEVYTTPCVSSTNLKLMGKKELTDAGWTEVADPSTKGDYRFFKVVVE